MPVCGTIRFVGILPPSCVRSEFTLPLRSPCAVPLPSQVLGQPGLAQQGVFVRLSVRSERNESAIRIAPNVPIMKGRISRNGYGGGYSGMSSAQFFVDGPGCQRLAVRSALFILCCPLFPSATGFVAGSMAGGRAGNGFARKRAEHALAINWLSPPESHPSFRVGSALKAQPGGRKPRSRGLNTLVCLEYLF